VLVSGVHLDGRGMAGDDRMGRIDGQVAPIAVPTQVKLNEVSHPPYR
jgi:hypothetical protein